ncbi:MAG: hypothetical protein ACKVS9_09185 [Phycisphaerae bacterium]
MAWDAIITSGSNSRGNAKPRQKVLRVGDNWIGVAGLSVYYNLLDHWSATARVPILRTERDVLGMFLKLLKALRSSYHFVNDQSDSDSPSPFSDFSAEFLVVNAHGMFIAKEILSITSYDSYCAIGSGSPFAEAAAFSLYDRLSTAREIAHESMKAALEFDRASGGPVESVSISV